MNSYSNVVPPYLRMRLRLPEISSRVGSIVRCDLVYIVASLIYTRPTSKNVRKMRMLCRYGEPSKRMMWRISKTQSRRMAVNAMELVWGRSRWMSQNTVGSMASAGRARAVTLLKRRMQDGMNPTSMRSER